MCVCVCLCACVYLRLYNLIVPKKREGKKSARSKNTNYQQSLKDGIALISKNLNPNTAEKTF